MTRLILRPRPPPAALLSSTAIFMPLETGTPQPLIGPDRSWWVPITISLAEMPSLVTLVWAAAGRWVSARALTARPHATSDFDMANISSLARVERRLGPPRSFAVFKNSDARSSFEHDLFGKPVPTFPGHACSRHRPFAIHGVDFGGVALVHEAALQLHGRRQLFVLGRQLTLDQEEALRHRNRRHVSRTGGGVSKHD